VSRRGEDESFHPHPGDPWHPEWHLEAEEAPPHIDGRDPQEGTGPAPASPRKGMGLFGRRRHRQDAPEEHGSPAGDEEPASADDGWAEAEPPPWVPGEAEPTAVPASATGGAAPADDGPDDGPGGDAATGGPEAPGDGVALAATESAGSPAGDDLLLVPAFLQPLREGPVIPPPPAPPAADDARDAGIPIAEGPTVSVGAAVPPALLPESPEVLETTEATEEEDWLAFAGGVEAVATAAPVGAAEAPRGRRRLFGSRKGGRREKAAAAADQGVAELQEVDEATPPSWDPDQAGLAGGGPEAVPFGTGAIFVDTPVWAVVDGKPAEAGLDFRAESGVPALEPAGAATADLAGADISDEEWERLFGGMGEEPAAAPPSAQAAGPVVLPPGGMAPGPIAPPPGPVPELRQPIPASGDTWAALRTVLEAQTVEMGAPVEVGPPVPGFEAITGEIFSGAATVEHRDLAEAVAAADTAETELQALSAPMAGLDMGVVGFEDVVDLGSDEEFVAPASSDFLRRVITGFVLLAMLVGALWVGGSFLAGFVGLIMFLGLTEYHRTLRACGHRPLALFAYLGAIGLLFGTWFHGLVAIPIAVVGMAVVVFFYYALAPRRRDPLTNGGLTVLGVAWVTGTAAFAFPIVASSDARVLILAVVAATVAMDVGAYSAGRSWGSSPLAPNLSPNKTVEGLAGGVVLTIGVCVALGYFLDPLDIRSGAALGLVVAAAAPLGDLAESMLKRSLGVKDMGSMLPGHGGILDRVDAFLFVLPAAWVLYQSLGLLG
jgi:phosphatidate cytidylyltransferase